MEGEATEDLALSGWENRQILTGQERELTSDRGPVTQRHGTHTAQTPRGTRRACARTHTPQDHCQVQMQSHSLALPPRPALSRAAQTGTQQHGQHTY